MRPYATLFTAALMAGALSTAVLAQPRPPVRRVPPRADGGAAADASVRAPDAGRAADAGRGPAGRTDASTATTDATATASDATTTASDATVTAAVVDGDAGAVSVGDASFPMRQVGTGTVVHFPVPEQFARTAVPVFVQVRSSAPVDHVSLFFRGLGARRYTELRMQAMGQQFRLASGYGAMVPCEDVFPPKVQYYVEVIDQSGSANGRAGTAEAPIEINVVDQRHFPAPTLPGQPAPRTCGVLTTAVTVRDAGAASNEPPRGSADLGEPCQATNDCRRGLRCGTNHQCVFEAR
jgi:hypothetical protein